MQNLSAMLVLMCTKFTNKTLAICDNTFIEKLLLHQHIRSQFKNLIKMYKILKSQAVVSTIGLK